MLTNKAVMPLNRNPNLSLGSSYHKILLVIKSCKTKDLSKKEKIRDIDLMIEFFQEVERYEDCAFLVKIKNKVIKHYKKIKQ